MGSTAPSKPMVKLVAPSPESFEIHLKADPAFTKKFGKKLRAIGGSYTSVVGGRETRFIQVANTPEGVELADQMIKQFGRRRTAVIMRGTGLSYAPSWVTVQEGNSIEKVLFTYNEKFENAVALSTQMVGDDQELRRRADGTYFIRSKNANVTEQSESAEVAGRDIRERKLDPTLEGTAQLRDILDVKFDARTGKDAGGVAIPKGINPAALAPLYAALKHVNLNSGWIADDHLRTQIAAAIKLAEEGRDLS